MRPYPIMFYPAGKQAVVIGGGKVAERKVARLLEAEADVTVVSPDVTNELSNLAKARKITWKNECFRPGIIEDAVIVIAATDSVDVNKRVAKATKPYQLLNVVNAPHLGNFHVPSTLARGDLTISIATNGASPKLSRKIRDEIAEIYSDRYIEYLYFLESTRNKILAKASLDEQKKQQLLATITEKKYLESTEERNDFLQELEKL